jgi:hypothetical protein
MGSRESHPGGRTGKGGVARWNCQVLGKMSWHFVVSVASRAGKHTQGSHDCGSQVVEDDPYPEYYAQMPCCQYCALIDTYEDCAHDQTY